MNTGENGDVKGTQVRPVFLMHPDDFTTETFRYQAVTHCQPFQRGVQCLTRGILFQKCVRQAVMCINKIRSQPDKTPESVDVLLFTDFISVISVKQCFRLIFQGANRFSGNTKLPWLLFTLKRNLSFMLSEPVKREGQSVKHKSRRGVYQAPCCPGWTLPAKPS